MLIKSGRFDSNIVLQLTGAAIFQLPDFNEKACRSTPY